MRPLWKKVLAMFWLTPGGPPPGPFGVSPNPRLPPKARINRGTPERAPVLTTCGYIRDNCLYILGAYDAGIGGIPFAQMIQIENATLPDGPVNFGAPDPAIETAVKEVRGSIMSKLQADSVERGAASLVERARCGDQIAMSILVMVGRGAKQGNTRALGAAKAVQKYIQANPAPVRMGSEHLSSVDSDAKTSRALWDAMSTDDLLQYSAAVIALVPCIQCPERSMVLLSHGPDIWNDAERLAALANCFGAEEQQKAFGFGVANSGNEEAMSSFGAEMGEDEQAAMQIGHCVGIARRIQAARQPGVSIGVLSKMAAWELE
jgi:hypothetical protein